MNEICKDCELFNLTEDLGLVKIPKTYVPKEVECLELVRSVTNSGIGCLYFRGVYVCDTLENPDKLMPEGIYRMDMTYSPKFKMDLPEIFVPKHKGVRIHTGNYIKNSNGCVLVGFHTFVEPILSHSTLMLEKVLKIIKECNVHYFKFS